jgi:hypothetical protein
MSGTQISFRQEDAKLIFLAVAYHLGRPGSELDPVTKRPVEHGLAEVARELQPQLRNAVATIEVNADQVVRLTSGMLGAVTELKAYPMLELRSEGGRTSTVPGFDRTLRHLFPAVEEDVDEAIEIAERMVMLRRRLGEELGTRKPIDGSGEGAGPSKKRGIWPFRR